MPGRILEGIVTTSDSGGHPHLAPMGPIVNNDLSLLRLRPFQTSKTFQNLKRQREGVLHVTDDVELLARAAVGKLETPPAMRPAETVAGWIMEDACRWYEFRVTSLDDSQERSEILAEVVAQGRQRDFFGFNRAMHAVLEAAILATRIDLLSPEYLLAEFERLSAPVQKTAGEKEQRAFDFLFAYLKSELVLRENKNESTDSGTPPGEAS